jgi:hypothetical protein
MADQPRFDREGQARRLRDMSPKGGKEWNLYNDALQRSRKGEGDTRNMRLGNVGNKASNPHGKKSSSLCVVAFLASVIGIGTAGQAAAPDRAGWSA